MTSPTESPFLRQTKLGRVWATCWRAMVKYNETDGEQRAASFAYYALFALMPLTVLLITIGTRFFGNHTEAANEVFRIMSSYIAVDLGSQEQVRATVEGFMRSRLGSGLISLAVLLWCALRFFQSLVHGVNQAWGTKEYTWWRLPLKNLLMMTILTSALLIGILVPTILESVEQYYREQSLALGFDYGWGGWLFGAVRWLFPPVLLFYALLLFFKFAPRRRTTLREVWLEALWVTVALGLVQNLFVAYAGRVANFNVLYGTFGSVVALLMWIYFTGTLIILGGCFCAARAEIGQGLGDQAEDSHAEWGKNGENRKP